jgi:predicted DsbA family dithiol-disulfide isomerase
VEELVWNVVEEEEVATTIKRITKNINMIKFGVSLVPAIVIENKIKVMGRKPRKEEILLWIMEEINEKKS